MVASPVCLYCVVSAFQTSLAVVAFETSAMREVQHEANDPLGPGTLLLPSVDFLSVAVVVGQNGAGCVVCDEIENFFLFEENVNLEFPLFEILTSKFGDVSMRGVAHCERPITC